MRQRPKEETHCLAWPEKKKSGRFLRSTKKKRKEDEIPRAEQNHV